MRFSTSFILAATAGLAGTMSAHASIIRGVQPGDTASMTLVMYNGALQSQTVNTGGQVSVPRGIFTDIGMNRNGTGRIQCFWDEVVQGNAVYVSTVFKTSNGEQFMPPSAQVNGQPAFFWTWNFGTANPVDFMDWVTSVTLVTARAFFSNTGGANYFASSNIAGNITESWNPGRDPGEIQASIGDGTNYILTLYEIRVVPAPATAPVIVAGALVAMRRRRR